jgi:hypothetical protein
MRPSWALRGGRVALRFAPQSRTLLMATVGRSSGVLGGDGVSD